MRRRRNYGLGSGLLCIVALAFVYVFIMPHVVFYKAPEFGSLKSYEALLKDCYSHTDVSRMDKTTGESHLLIGMVTSCPYMSFDHRPVDTFEIFPPPGPADQICKQINQYKGKKVKLYYSTERDYVRYTTAPHASFSLWQLEIGGRPVINFSTQVDLWKKHMNDQRFWFLLLFVFPLVFMFVPRSRDAKREALDDAME